MAKKFYTAGVCIPEQNYMVDVSGRVDTIIAEYIDEGKYFTVNRARQYGKSTMLYLLEQRLNRRYLVVRLSFERRTRCLCHCTRWRPGWFGK